MKEVFALRLFEDDPRAGRAILKLVDPTIGREPGYSGRLFDEAEPSRPRRIVRSLRDARPEAAPSPQTVGARSHGGSASLAAVAVRAGGLPLPIFVGGRENRLVLHVADEVLGARRWEWLVPPDDLAGGPTPPEQKSLFASEPGDDACRLVVLFGSPGVGKSHLARGFASVLEGFGLETIVLTSADFARDYARAVDEDAINDFRARFVRVGLVVIENLQDLEDKPAAMTEFRHLIDRLSDHGVRLIVTSSVSPAAMLRLESGLAGRLSAGLTVPIHPPKEAARRVILERLAERHRLPLTDKALDRLTEKAVGAVPRLNNLVLELLAKDRDRQLRGETTSTTASVLPPPGPRASAHDRPRPGTGESETDPIETVLANREAAERPSMAKITQQVAKYFRTRTSELKGPTRKQAVVTARSVAMYLARELTDLSLAQVGQHFGGRDHTTVLHACRKTKDALESDHRVQTAIRDLCRILGQPDR